MCSVKFCNTARLFNRMLCTRLLEYLNQQFEIRLEAPIAFLLMKFELLDTLTLKILDQSDEGS
jgi:hypothetical protein